MKVSDFGEQDKLRSETSKIDFSSFSSFYRPKDFLPENLDGERFRAKERYCNLYSRGSSNLNGKFWNFWPNFIHLKSFSVVCYHRVRFSFPYSHYVKALNAYIWKYLCLIFMSFTSLFFLQRNSRNHQASLKEKKEKKTFAGQI